MTPFFIKKIGNRSFLKLNRVLYSASLIEKVKNLEPENVGDVKRYRDYHLVEIKADSPNDLFDFLNFLIYHQRAS